LRLGDGRLTRRLGCRLVHRLPRGARERRGPLQRSDRTDRYERDAREPALAGAADLAPRI
jgi:hypothetical protein